MSSNRPGYLYRAFDGAGALLYIGATINPTARLMTHQGRAEWWAEVATITVRQYQTRAAALDAEEEALLSESPKYNIRSRHGVLDIKRYHARLDELAARRRADYEAAA